MVNGQKYWAYLSSSCKYRKKYNGGNTLISFNWFPSEFLKSGGSLVLHELESFRIDEDVRFLFSAFKSPYLGIKSITESSKSDYGVLCLKISQVIKNISSESSGIHRHV